MVIWTIVPEESLLQEQEGHSGYALKNEREIEEINYAGCKIMARALNENQYQIIRLITTDPNDYLNSELVPGKVISCKKTFEALSG